MLLRKGIAVLLMMVAAPSVVRSAKSAENDVQMTLAAFIQAFDNLDWERFRAFFSDDATVFYPRGMPERAQGRAEFEAGFRKVFEQIRSGRSQPPFMDLQPRGLKIQLAGELAIATFHLDDRPGFVNRRTIVLMKVGTDWKIVHLHASEVAVAHK